MNHMKKQIYFMVLIAAAVCYACTEKSDKGRAFNSLYEGEYLNRIAFPVGGMGSGMFCLDGTGSISNMSVRHRPDVFHEPCMFAAVHVKGLENGTKVLEKTVPDWKKFGGPNSALGNGGTNWGLPRFEEATFSTRFPFADIRLKDKDLPVDVNLKGWSPFIPTDEDHSGMPIGAIEYTFKNTGSQEIELIFSFNSVNFMRMGNNGSSIAPTTNGYILTQSGTENEPFRQGEFAIYTDQPQTVVNNSWFHGGWFDPLTICWNHIKDGVMESNNAVEEGSSGASLYVPFQLKAHEEKTIKLLMAWYVPYTNLRIGPEPASPEDFPSYNEVAASADSVYFAAAGSHAYRPWYSNKFKNMQDVTTYWKTHYDDLKAKSQLFTDAFYNSSLPPEVIEAVAANLTILKSPTVFRQYDGRMWNWEGSGDTWGSCHGSCTHVWNYAQAVPHLFPNMERSLRETEFLISQNSEGHQAFRSNLPIRPLKHDFHAASDGQLGGIMKVYRDWRISGDNEWLKKLYPGIKQSLDYCSAVWDPKGNGALEEPHHNTYDIEFWGPDGMCTSFYTGALQALILMGKAVGDDVSHYETLLTKSKDYMENKLYNGEYFIQDVRWKDLNAPDPTKAQSMNTQYSPEARVILEKEGPKYQYGTGCLSDGILGSWMSLVCGMPEVIDKAKVTNHLVAVHKYNLEKDIRDHANPQRPTFAMGDDGGLLLCSWPHGGKLQLPFVYSDEVWTGIEYQVASHLMFEGEVEKGLDIVRTCRKRYDGRIRNPFNEYECGAWYARAMASYGLLEGLTGVRYDAVDGTLYLDSRIGNNFCSFLSTNTGFGNVGLKGGKPFLEVKYGSIPVKKWVVSNKETTADKETNANKGTFGYDLDYLSKRDSVIVLTGDDGLAQIIVSAKYQAKVFTSSADGLDGKSLGFVNYKVFDSGVTDEHMNGYGGENRFWIGPEGGKYSVYFQPGAEQVYDHWHTPKPIDTEPWEIAFVNRRNVSLKKEMEVTNYVGSQLKLRVDRHISLIETPKIKSGLNIDLNVKVKTVAYTTENSITNLNDFEWTEATGTICIWILDMFNPGRQALTFVPFNEGNESDLGKIVTSDYFGEIPADRLKIDDHLVYLKTDGKYRSKIGLNGKRTQAIAGNYDPEVKRLTVVSFEVAPSAVYLNQEWNPKKNPLIGDALNAYNDGPLEDGSIMGPFLELESVSPAAFLKPQESLSHKHTVYHFIGEEKDLNPIAEKLFGTSLREIRSKFAENMCCVPMSKLKN
jgi:uncharacterized protein (DUF608 family)